MRLASKAFAKTIAMVVRQELEMQPLALHFFDLQLTMICLN
jgi:hypothetical protein